LKHYLAALALITVLVPMQQVHAAVQFEPEKKVSYADQRAAEFENIARSILGKTYWFEPNSRVGEYSRLKFRETLPSTDKSAYDNHHAPTFRPSGKTPFTVTNVFVFKNPKEEYLGPEYYAEITFEGGKIGYLHLESSITAPFKVYRADDAFLLDLYEMVYTEDPDVIRQREEEATVAAAKKQVAAEKAWNARGGVRIGMTKKQVLASNWGEPEDINTTSTRNGTFEQWVYEDGNYLYFTNGRLTGIQN
jgi:hypothetical protein